MIPLNRVLTDSDRELLAPTMKRMLEYWPEMYWRKIADSMVQFAFCYQTVLDLTGRSDDVDTVLSAGSHEDIATECLKIDAYSVVGIDPVLNCDLHTFMQRAPHKFDFVVSASVLEHTINDEEFICDACSLLRPGGYGVFTMDFKNDWTPGERVPNTSNRFYTEFDLTHRLPRVLGECGCRVVGPQDYSARDRFSWEGISYGFASLVCKKEGSV